MSTGFGREVNLGGVPHDESGRKTEGDRGLNQEFQKAKNLFLAAFQGLTVSQETELRRTVRAAGSHYKVVKNTLAQKASKDTPIEQIHDKFAGTTAIAYNEKDPVVLAKALTTYAKNNPLFVFKAGVVEGRVISLARHGSNRQSSFQGRADFQVDVFIEFPGTTDSNRLGGVARNLAVVLNQAGEQKKFQE